MPTGRMTTYDLTVGLYLDIENMIHLLDPFDIPLQGGSGADGRSALSTGTCFEKKVEWLDETLLVARSLLVGAHSTNATFVTVTTGDQLRFSTGDVILVENEYMRITGYGSTADTLLVTRTYAGTGRDARVGQVAVGVGTALAEGADPENARAIDRANRYNITQIFGPTAVQVSGSENAVKKYGIEGVGEFQHQVANRTKELAVSIDQALVYGVRLEDGANKWRTMGGLDYFITALVDTSTTTITESTVLDQLQASYNAEARSTGSWSERSRSGRSPRGPRTWCCRRTWRRTPVARRSTTSTRTSVGSRSCSTAGSGTTTRTDSRVTRRRWKRFARWCSRCWPRPATR